MSSDLDDPIAEQLRTLGTRLLADSPPVTAEEVFQRHRTIVDPEPVATSSVGWRRRITWARAGTVVASAAAVTLLAVGLAGRGTDAPQQDAARGATPDASGSPAAGGLTDIAWPPRLLLDGAEMVDLDEASPGVGGATFVLGGGRASGYLQWSDDPGLAGIPVDVVEAGPSAEFLGHETPIYQPGPQPPMTGEIATTPVPVAGDSDYRSIFVSAGNHSIQIYSSDLSPDDFAAAVASFRLTNETEWASFLPVGTVTPDQRSGVIDQMLVGVPIPHDYEDYTIRDNAVYSRRSSLGYDLGQSITCAWLHQWADATGSGDEAAATEATDALAGIAAWRPWIESDFVLARLPFVQDDGTITLGRGGRSFDADFVDEFCSPGIG